MWHSGRRWELTHVLRHPHQTCQQHVGWLWRRPTTCFSPRIPGSQVTVFYFFQYPWPCDTQHFAWEIKNHCLLLYPSCAPERCRKSPWAAPNRQHPEDPPSVWKCQCPQGEGQHDLHELVRDPRFGPPQLQSRLYPMPLPVVPCSERKGRFVQVWPVSRPRKSSEIRAVRSVQNWPREGALELAYETEILHSGWQRMLPTYV